MAVASVIGRGSVVRGNVRGEGNLEILGRVEGDVVIEGDVALGEDAVVRGNVTGAQLSIAGTVQGELRGSESVLVERGARVVGDLTSPRIGIAPGALVKGNVRTDGEPPLASAQRRPGSAAQATRTPLAAAKPAVHAPAAHAPAAHAPAPKAEAAKSAPAVIHAPIERDFAEEPPKREKAEAPAPVVPALGKHAKAKKKRREG